MDLEKELTILEVDKNDLEETLNKLNAEKVGDFFQRRLVYDFNPVNPKKWIRLRTNGKKTTITIKEVVDKTIIDGTKELEIVVDDFDKANLLLEELGYKARNYQENKRTIYNIDNVEVSIDSWPMIPTYAELEGKTNEDVKSLLNKLNTKNYKITTFDVESIYKEIYNIDILKIKDLRFDNK